MKRKLYFSVIMLFTVVNSDAQTWTGNVNNVFHLAANWDNNSIPNASSNVIIPAAGTVTNWPRLTFDMEVGSLTMGAGSSLDVNGRVITLNTTGLNLIGGAITPITISNSNAGTDIYIQGDAGTWQVGNTVFNDNVIYQINVTVPFTDGYSTAATVYNGNVTYNMSSTNDMITCQSFPNVYGGNVTVSRTLGAMATTNLFFKGHAGIAGNLTVTNNLGGNVSINGTGSTFSTVQGVINIDVTNSGNGNNNDFYMFSMINNTAGGHINLSNLNRFALSGNTLKTNVYISNLQYLQSNNLNRIGDNDITGNFTLENTTGTHVPVYTGGNNFTGITNFNVSGGQLFTGYSGFGADVFNGNTTITLGVGETLYESHGYPNQYNGNLTVTRTGEGNINLFMSGHAGISGNFSFTNLHGYFGEDYINKNNITTAPIQGTINIDVNLGTAGSYQLFQMKGIVNNTAGGTINIANQADVSLQNNTLKADINITSLRLGGWPITINGNNFTGNFLLNNLDGIQVYTGGNHFNGTTSFTVSNGRLFTAYPGLGADTYNGNTNITIGNWADLFESDNYGNQYNGNLTITRTGISSSQVNILFNAGHVAISGNFTFSSPYGGYTSLNEQGSASALIQGSVNIEVSNALEFRMRGVSNNTAGGTITINNCGSINMSKDTLLANVAVTNITGSGDDVFYQNKITGSFTLSDDIANGAGIFTGGNTINGATAYTLNSAASFNTSAGGQGKDIHNGSFTLARNGAGSFVIAKDNDVEWNGDVNLNYASFVNYNPANKIIIGGSGNSSIQQLGTAAVLIPNLQMNKSGGTALLLSSPLYISNNLEFINGIINSTASNFLQLNDNATVTGASAASHVNGVVQKAGDDAFNFPIGTATTFNPVAITAPANVNDVFSATYFNTNPHPVYDTSSHAATVARVSGCEYWDVKRLNGTSNVSLTFTYDQPCAGPNYITNPANVHIVHWNGTSWEDLGNGGFNGTLSGTVTTAGPVSSFSPFTLASTNIILNPLPLTLLSFTGQRGNNGVTLKWTTTDEKNVSHFEIERSNNGIAFIKLGTVTAASVSGINNYVFDDITPKTGTNYYRLKMVDTDGSFEWSKIINLKFSHEPQITIYPVPASATITVQFANQFKHLEIVDMAGRVLFRKNITQQTEIIEISALAKGLYFVRLNNDNGIISKRFVKE